ncbi:MAG: TolC family protein [Pseudomonadota bacterium]|nr:TolC family protein [Pseudomonadota bacterium]
MKKIILLMLFLSINGHATDLISLYERAKQHNIDILNNQIDLDIANESLKQTRSTVYPEINFNARASETTIERYKSLGSYDPSNYDRDTYNLSIKQPLLHLYVFDEIKKAKSSLEQNEITRNNADSLLILESVRHYFNLIKFKNAVALSEIETDYRRSGYRVSSKLYEDGSISVEEYETLKNNYESSKNDLNVSKNNLSQIKNDVYIFSGKELNDINDIELSTINHKNLVLDDLIHSALTNNNTIRMSKQGMSINRNEIAAQRSRHYPTIDLVVEYDYIDITQGGSQFGATTREDSTISLVLNFPIFNGGYQSSKIKEARLNYQKARLDHTNSKRLIRKEIIDTFNIYNTNQGLYSTALQILKTYSNKYENAQEGYDKGIYTNTQMLEAKLEYSKALFDAKNIMMDYLYSELTLDHLQNSLNASSLRRINTYLAW